jgi:hypothetical protein
MTSFAKVILIAIVLLCTAVWYFANRAFTAETDLGNSNAMSRQNRVAYEDQIRQRDSSIQQLTVKVGDLNTKVDHEVQRKGYWIAFAGELNVKLDSIRNAGTGIASTGEDSTGKYLKVDFKGKKGILTYVGNTLYYLPPASIQSRYWLDVSFDDIAVFSSLFQDVDELWKIRTESRTPGVKLKSNFAIDSTIYIGLRSTMQNQADSHKDFLPPFGIRWKGNIATTVTDLSKNLQGLSFDTSLEGYYKYYNITWYPLTGVVSGGLVYTFDIGNFLERIF